MIASRLWLVWAILSLLTYASWGVFNSLASRYISANLGLFCSSLGYLAVGVLSIMLLGLKPNIALHELFTRGGAYGFAVGIATGLGGLFLLISIHSGGNSNIVIALTATYPLIAVAFNVTLLHDSISLQQLTGIIFSVIGVMLILTK